MLKPLTDEDMPEGIEFISLHGDYGGWFRTLLYFVIYTPPGVPDTVTITVREKSTGAVRKVTAFDQSTALQKLSNGIYD